MGKGWRIGLQPDAEGEHSRPERAVQGTYSTFPMIGDVLVLLVRGRPARASEARQVLFIAKLRRHEVAVNGKSHL